MNMKTQKKTETVRWFCCAVVFSIYLWKKNQRINIKRERKKESVYQATYSQSFRMCRTIKKDHKNKVVYWIDSTQKIISDSIFGWFSLRQT